MNSHPTAQKKITAYLENYLIRNILQISLLALYRRFYRRHAAPQ